MGGLGCLGALVVIVFAAIFVAAVKSPGTSSSGAGAASAPIASTPTAGKAAAAPSKPTTAAAAPPQKPVTVLTEHGNGIKTTKSFTVHGDWDLAYSFDCANFGAQGNFSVMVNGAAGDLLVNELAEKGSDTTHEHDGPGKIALDVNSECTWSIRVDQLP